MPLPTLKPRWITPDEDIDVLEKDDLVNQLRQVETALEEILATADTGRILREGVAVAIVGRPNVGKSSLLNLLLRENRALVTDIAGTTRDLIEETMNLRGGSPSGLSILRESGRPRMWSRP